MSQNRYIILKPAIFHPKALQVVQSFPAGVKKDLGDAIRQIQEGQTLGMPLCRQMPQVAVGVEELRIRNSNGNYRVFLMKKWAHGVLVFHAFIKKTPKTPKDEIALGQRRLKEMIRD